jgi:hypothetical protein
MSQLIKLTVALFIAIIVSAFPTPSVQAEASQPAPPKANLIIQVNIDQPDIFWNYTFLTKNSTLSKPSAVKLVWGLGVVQRQAKNEIVVTGGKTSGQVTVVTDKGELINIRVAVCDSKGTTLGFTSIQVKNNGQTETFVMSPPDSTEPKITWGNL